jgi:hypothetical protein
MCYSVRSFRTPLHQKEQILLKRRKDNKISQNQTDFTLFLLKIPHNPKLHTPHSELHTSHSTLRTQNSELAPRNSHPAPLLHIAGGYVPLKSLVEVIKYLVSGAWQIGTQSAVSLNVDIEEYVGCRFVNYSIV